MLSLDGSEIREIPRNAINFNRFIDLRISSNNLRFLDFFSFNQETTVERFRVIDVSNNPIEGLDFNIFERTNRIDDFFGTSMSCYNGNIFGFDQNRAANLALLEPCFIGFDRRVLCKQISLFKSI